MNINGTSKNQYQNKVLIDTLIEQISALQTDVGNLQIADDNLAQALSTKVDSTSISEGVNTSVINAQTGNIKNLNVQGTGSSATIENATIGTAAINTEAVNQSTITNLEVMDVDAGTVRTGTAIVENDATISGNLSVQDIDAKDITSVSVNTLNTVTAEATINKLESHNAEVKGKLEVNDLEVSGSFTGVSHIQSEQVETESITADSADIDLVNTKDIRNWVSQVMNQAEALVPTPALSNIDRYTIELPSFNGIYLLSWEDSNVLWSATVIGNGKTYGISWGSLTGENYVTDLFQFNGKAYIRINCNGRLKFAYSATKELSQPTIYYNMGGWPYDKSLEELCTDNTHIINAYASGLVWFGNVTIPSIGGGSGQGINFMGSCVFADLPSLSEVSIGDVWNITDEAYTDNRFVEGAGKPINAGDDLVAVAVEEDGNLVIYWDKFSAGVNYENFRAENITAETLLKSEGTLEVDGETELHDSVTLDSTLEVTGNATFNGTTEFNDDVTSNADITVNGVVDAEDLQGRTLRIFDPNGPTGSPYLEVNKDSNHGVNTNMNISHHGDYTGYGSQTITGNLNRTGNETISGVVTIGELN